MSVRSLPGGMGTLALGLAVLAPLAACAEGDARGTQAAERGAEGPRGGQELFGHYEIVEGWPQPLPDEYPGQHDGWTWGSQAAVYAETPDRIWVAQRGELPLPDELEPAPWTPYGEMGPIPGASLPVSPRRATGYRGRGFDWRPHHMILVLDRQGNMVEWWQQHDHLFDHAESRGPHKVKMSPYDPDRHVWIIDDWGHVIHKFTYGGELVMTLGELGVEGRGPNTFARPTDIAWLPDGTFFISDGYHGTRVAKFDPDGNFLMDWGGPPADPDNPGPNEWNTVHSIAVSADRRVFVADRGHRRIQVFDENGEFLDMWSLGPRSSPYAIIITEDQHLWISDGGTNRILKYDLDGNYLYGWGQPGRLPGQFNGPHSISVDQEGNLYVAEVFNGRLTKFRPRGDADPAKIAAPEVRLAH